ncbi:hypothetical protein QEZ52_07890 [Aliisedimentitalea scapharcae]|uniref:Uncharacterized protein n=1 Tax=Aliisedimentitalea scapharcae TaxID=1524259 RepID=A0ABZ2XX54_9RHOB
MAAGSPFATFVPGATSAMLREQSIRPNFSKAAIQGVMADRTDAAPPTNGREAHKATFAKFGSPSVPDEPERPKRDIYEIGSRYNAAFAFLPFGTWCRIFDG